MTNQQDRQIPGSANPKEISQQCTPTVHTEAVHRQGSSWGFPSLSVTTKGSWLLLGTVTQALVSPLMPVHSAGLLARCRLKTMEIGHETPTHVF